MWNDFNEATEAKKDVAAVKARKTPKSKNDNSFGTAKQPVKKQFTHPPPNHCERCEKSPGHLQQNCPAKTRLVTSIQREVTGELFASRRK